MTPSTTFLGCDIFSSVLSIMGTLFGVALGFGLTQLAAYWERKRHPIDNLLAVIRDELRSMSDYRQDQAVDVDRHLAPCVNRIGADLILLRSRNPENWQEVEKCWENLHHTAKPNTPPINAREMRNLLVALSKAAGNLKL